MESFLQNLRLESYKIKFFSGSICGTQSGGEALVSVHGRLIITSK